MTEWQWSVVIALCKLVKMLLVYGGAAFKHPDTQKPLRIIEDAIGRTKL